MGEGIYALRNIVDTTSPVYWTVEIVAGTVMVAVALWRNPLGRGPALLCIGIWLLGAAVFLALAESALVSGRP